MEIFTENLDFDSKGLIPAIVQDVETSQVLMMAYMNAESLSLTLSTGETHFCPFRNSGSVWIGNIGLGCILPFEFAHALEPIFLLKNDERKIVGTDAQPKWLRLVRGNEESPDE